MSRFAVNVRGTVDDRQADGWIVFDVVVGAMLRGVLDARAGLHALACLRQVGVDARRRASKPNPLSHVIQAARHKPATRSVSRCGCGPAP